MKQWLEDGPCESVINGDICGLDKGRRDLIVGSSFGGTAGLPECASGATVLQYPNLENAWQASNGLRVSINETRNRQREQTITVADLVDHYIATELASDQLVGGKSHATKTIYTDFLTRWVRPIWGSLNIRDVRTITVEQWLRGPSIVLFCSSGCS
jgi:hypothetical protein